MCVYKVYCVLFPVSVCMCVYKVYCVLFPVSGIENTSQRLCYVENSSLSYIVLYKLYSNKQDPCYLIMLMYMYIDKLNKLIL